MITYLTFELTQSLETMNNFAGHQQNNNITSMLSNPDSTLYLLNYGQLWDLFDPALKSVLEDVDVKIANSGDATTVSTFPLKLFVAREVDICETRLHSVQAEFDSTTTDQYYVPSTPEKRKKIVYNDAYDGYWMSSPAAGTTTDMLICFSGNSPVPYSANSGQAGIPVRFAL